MELASTSAPNAATPPRLHKQTWATALRLAKEALLAPPPEGGTAPPSPPPDHLSTLEAAADVWTRVMADGRAPTSDVLPEEVGGASDVVALCDPLTDGQHMPPEAFVYAIPPGPDSDDGEWKAFPVYGPAAELYRGNAGTTSLGKRPQLFAAREGRSMGFYGWPHPRADGAPLSAYARPLTEWASVTHLLPAPEADARWIDLPSQIRKWTELDLCVPISAEASPQLAIPADSDVGTNSATATRSVQYHHTPCFVPLSVPYAKGDAAPSDGDSRVPSFQSPSVRADEIAERCKALFEAHAYVRERALDAKRPLKGSKLYPDPRAKEFSALDVYFGEIDYLAHAENCGAPRPPANGPRDRGNPRPPLEAIADSDPTAYWHYRTRARRDVVTGAYRPARNDPVRSDAFVHDFPLDFAATLVFAYLSGQDAQDALAFVAELTEYRLRTQADVWLGRSHAGPSVPDHASLARFRAHTLALNGLWEEYASIHERSLSSPVARAGGTLADVFNDAHSGAVERARGRPKGAPETKVRAQAVLEYLSPRNQGVGMPAYDSLGFDAFARVCAEAYAYDVLGPLVRGMEEAEKMSYESERKKLRPGDLRIVQLHHIAEEAAVLSEGVLERLRQ